MTDTLAPPTNGVSTRKLKTELVDVIGETLEALRPESRAQFLTTITSLRAFGPDLDVALRGINKAFAKAGTDGSHDATLADTVQFHRKEVRR